jgi:hypothetical protein
MEVQSKTYLQSNLVPINWSPGYVRTAGIINAINMRHSDVQSQLEALRSK